LIDSVSSKRLAQGKNKPRSAREIADPINQRWRARRFFPLNNGIRRRRLMNSYFSGLGGLGGLFFCSSE
jgi:hypothetical protein